MGKYLSRPERETLLKELNLEKYRRYADRIRVILLLDEGKTASSIADYLFLTDKTVRHYLKSYQSGGIEQLVFDDYRGKEFRLTELHREELVEHLSKNLYRTTIEIKEYILSHYGIEYKTGGVRHLLRRLGFVYKKPKAVPGKADKNKQEEFIKELEKLKRSKNPLYFVDGVHPQHNTFCEYGWILKGEDFEIKTNTGRSRLNINGALNAKDAQDIFIDESESVNSQSTIRLLQQIEKANLDATKINVVVDNAMYYKSALVKEFLKTSKINLVFLPPYSPNLNLIERLWRVLNRNILYNVYFEKFADFKSAILEFFENIENYSDEVKKALSFKFHLVGN